jgi:hypothetical protein
MGKLEKAVEIAYRRWKGSLPKAKARHPDEETLACFLESKLNQREAEEVRAHLVSCDLCCELVALTLGIKPQELREVPEFLLDSLKGMVAPQGKKSLLEVVLRVKEKAFEVIHTTGDIIVGQELIPAPVLRSRQIKDFKDEITVLKDFNDIRVEAKIENKGGKVFDVTISAKNKLTQKAIKDVRVTLSKDELELESCLADKGAVTFEHVALGRYSVEVATLDNKTATITLDIKS